MKGGYVGTTDYNFGSIIIITTFILATDIWLQTAWKRKLIYLGAYVFPSEFDRGLSQNRFQSIFVGSWTSQELGQVIKKRKKKI